MLKKYVGTSKFVVFDKYGKKIKTVTLKHKSNLYYLEIEPFEEELIKNGFYGHAKESLDQQFLKGKLFKEKLICLGWKFDENGKIIE